MSKRSEFSSKTRDQAYARAKGKCENHACGLPLQIGKFAYDHILPDALGGKPTLANCQVLCSDCHGAKTAKQDVPRIRKADRQRKAHIGAKPSPKVEIKGKPFAPPSPKDRTPTPKSRVGDGSGRWMFGKFVPY
jgi:hypothetical protein